MADSGRARRPDSGPAGRASAVGPAVPCDIGSRVAQGRAPPRTQTQRAAAPLEAVGAAPGGSGCAPSAPPPSAPPHSGGLSFGGRGRDLSLGAVTPPKCCGDPPHGRGSWRGSGVRCRVLQGHERPATHIGGSRGTCLSLSGFRPSESVYTADLSLANTNVSLWFVSCSLAFGNGEASRGTLSSRPKTRSAWHLDALEAEQSPGRLPSAPRGS